MFPSSMRGVCGVPDKARHFALTLFALLVLLLGASGDALAHAVAEGDKGYIQEIYGIHLMSFIYLGAKHMVTGYDHILFLLAVCRT
ncbi:HupE/UreJ family protein, partial [Halomonas sp. PBN3]|uniref:HupE/UreJ family protein n=1 Tax=Halomonas sp. PBN3 TaxID=1397528 RepID=UPI0004CEEBA7